jgi:hypothetical protein
MSQKGRYLNIVTFVLPKSGFHKDLSAIKYFFQAVIFITKNALNQINEYNYGKNQTQSQ